MYTCASCTLRSCQKGGGDLPRNCPMRDPEFFDRLLERYWSEENHDFFVTSAAIESAGYCRWPRLKEIVEFSRSMHYQKLGLAFCAALKKEAAVVERVLRNNGFQVVLVVGESGIKSGLELFALRPGDFTQQLTLWVFWLHSHCSLRFLLRSSAAALAYMMSSSQLPTRTRMQPMPMMAIRMPKPYRISASPSARRAPPRISSIAIP